LGRAYLLIIGWKRGPVEASTRVFIKQWGGIGPERSPILYEIRD
jgi:hypothetical protein